MTITTIMVIVMNGDIIYWPSYFIVKSNRRALHFIYFIVTNTPWLGFFMNCLHYIFEFISILIE